MINYIIVFTEINVFSNSQSSKVVVNLIRHGLSEALFLLSWLEYDIFDKVIVHG